MTEVSEAMQAAIEAIVAKAPPMSEAQVRLIVRLLRYHPDPRLEDSATISSTGEDIDADSFGGGGETNCGGEH